MAARPSLTGLQREVDRVDAAQNKHEAECAIRYKNLDERMGDVYRRTGRIETAAWSLLAAILLALLTFVMRGGA